MTHSTQMLILLVTPLSAATAQSVSSDHAGIHSRMGTIRAP